MSAYTSKILHLDKIIERSTWACYCLYHSSSKLGSINSLCRYLFHKKRLSNLSSKVKEACESFNVPFVFLKFFPGLRLVLLVSGFWVSPVPSTGLCLASLELEAPVVPPVLSGPSLSHSYPRHFLKTLSWNTTLEQPPFLFMLPFGYCVAWGNAMCKHAAGPLD